FWGAPLLAGEFERGTNKLVWTQSVPPRRWLAVKLSLLSLAVAAGGLLLSAMVSAWRSVFDRDDVFGNIGVFNMVGVAPWAWGRGLSCGARYRRWRWSSRCWRWPRSGCPA